MQIDFIYYPVKTLGYGERIGIWTLGCNHHCYNCSNPELWNSDINKNISVEHIIEMIKGIKHADGVTITGGEPFLQANELLTLVDGLRKMGYFDILVYSGYERFELESLSIESKKVLERIGVLIDGVYVDELNDNRSIRGSSNQKIHILNDALYERYKDVDKWERQTQVVVNNDAVLALGVPRKH